MVRILLVGPTGPPLDLEDSLLEREECEVVEVPSVAEAIDRARESPFDLILLAIPPTGPDAAPSARALKDAPASSSIPLILVAAPRDRPRFEGVRAEGFVGRPLTASRLVEAIRRFHPIPERRGERLEIGLKADYRAGERQGIAFIHDLGSDGAFVATRDRLEPGESVELAFALPVPGGRVVRLQGSVVRVVVADGAHARPGVGVRFRSPSAADRVEIVRFLRRKQGSAS